MTLHTRIVVKDPVPVKPLFEFCQSLLGAPGAQEWSHDERGFVQTRPDTDPTKGFMRLNNAYRNTLGQGLPALMWVEYGPDGPLDLGMPDRHRYCDDDCDCAEYEAHNGGCIEVNFDTAYGYRAEQNSAGCADLHAWLVLMTCGYLDDLGAKYEWYQEFTGEWFTSPLDVVHLGDAELGALTHSPQHDRELDR